MNAKHHYATPNAEKDETHLEKKWSGKRIVRDETTPWQDPGIDFTDDPGKTDQSQAADCDVNTIVNRFMKTGVMPQYQGNPVYGDYSEVPDYQTALEIVANAKSQFEGLDAKTRARFNNNPVDFLSFVNDPKNGEEMVNLGLAIERPQEPPRAPDPAPKKTDSAPA